MPRITRALGWWRSWQLDADEGLMRFLFVKDPSPWRRCLGVGDGVLRRVLVALNQLHGERYEDDGELLKRKEITNKKIVRMSWGAEICLAAPC